MHVNFFIFDEKVHNGVSGIIKQISEMRMNDPSNNTFAEKISLSISFFSRYLNFSGFRFSNISYV